MYNYKRVEGRCMKKEKNCCLKDNNNQIVTTLSLLWLFACLLGTLLLYMPHFPHEIDIKRYFEVLPQGIIYSPFQKEFWLFLISSARQDILFVFLLAVSSCDRYGIYVAYFGFFIRGFLFGLGGTLVAMQMQTSVFFVILFRQILLISAFLFFAASLFVKAHTKTKMYSEQAFLLFSTLCEIGVSLLIHFVFCFV